MKPVIKHLALCAVLGASGSTQASPVLFPNGDFEIADGASWEENGDGVTFDYPTTGGNSDGYGVITTGIGQWGIWVSNDGAPTPLGSLGLTAGKSYTFTQDMIILSGSNIGGLKIESWDDSGAISNTGDVYPALIGTGDTWETYSFNYTISPAATGIKIVPLWGPESSVGFDNFGVDNTPILLPLIPNGDFENGATSWQEIGAGTSWSYPEDGGNPDRYGVMTNDGSGFGIWVANGGAPMSLTSLGLSAGETTTFKMDMRILSGTKIGGLKVEFLEGATFLGDTGDIFPTPVGDGTEWATYSFDIPIPANADHIKVVPLWGKLPEDGAPNSVGYDNITFVRPAPTIFAASIAIGTMVSWTAEGADSFYQPQSSTDNAVWTNLGPNLFGDAVTSAFDPDDAPFHRVEETFLDVINDILNGDFENSQSADPSCPESWNCVTNDSQVPTRITTDFRSAPASVQIMVVNDDRGTPNSAEIQQNISLEGGEVVPGATYDFSFWAKQISSGVSYVQKFQLQWLNDSGAPLGGGIAFADFAGGSGDWTEVKASGLVAPEEAETAYIQIFGSTGAVAGATAEGGVLIDDVSLSTSMVEPIETLTTTTSPAVEISWPTTSGVTYQAKSSDNLIDFTNLGDAITGDGGINSVIELLTTPAKYYQVEEGN